MCWHLAEFAPLVGTRMIHYATLKPIVDTQHNELETTQPRQPCWRAVDESSCLSFADCDWVSSYQYCATITQTEPPTVIVSTDDTHTQQQHPLRQVPCWRGDNERECATIADCVWKGGLVGCTRNHTSVVRVCAGVLGERECGAKKRCVWRRSEDAIDGRPYCALRPWSRDAQFNTQFNTQFNRDTQEHVPSIALLRDALEVHQMILAANNAGHNQETLTRYLSDELEDILDELSERKEESTNNPNAT